MSDQIRAVVGCEHAGCGQVVMRGDEVGRVADWIAVGDAEVWEVAWPDGTMNLLHTAELAGYRPDRPPDRPPSREFRPR